MRINKLSLEQVIKMHKAITDGKGGRDMARDLGLLDSALASPFMILGQYPTIQEKAARLAYGIIRNHPFIDGNKRLGAHTMLVFLALNGIRLNYGQKELASLIINVASSRCGYGDILEWIRQKERLYKAYGQYRKRYFTAQDNDRKV